MRYLFYLPTTKVNINRFAFQDMTENFIAGVAMGIRKPFEIGDVIEAEGVFGNVKEINLRNTLVETFYGQLEVIPNKILFRNILTNYSYLGLRLSHCQT